MRRLNRLFRRHRPLAIFGLLGPAVIWMLAIYVISLVLLVGLSFNKLGELAPTDEKTIENLQKAFMRWDFFVVVVRSVVFAILVTLLCLAIALPTAFYISKIAKPWARRGLIVACLLPLWAGYLVKGYAWKAMLRPAGEGSDGGFLLSVFGFTPGFSRLAVILALTYLWVPYMILPVYTGLERLPASLLDASGDLGAKPARTFVSVVVPLLVPSIAAGSIFTFSLSLGDYIMPRLVTEGQVTILGNFINNTITNNPPLAAAYTIWPLLIIIVFLLLMKRLGAFDNL